MITSNGDIPEYTLYINSKPVEFKLTNFLRQEVILKHNIENKNVHCAFKIEAEIKEEVKNIDLVATIDNKQNKMIKKIDINKSKIISLVDYNIDNITLHPNLGIVSGWSNSYIDEEVEYKVFDNSGKEIDKNIKKLPRTELIKLQLVKKSNT